MATTACVDMPVPLGGGDSGYTTGDSVTNGRSFKNIGDWGPSRRTEGQVTNAHRTSILVRKFSIDHVSIESKP